jgi:4-amino-4-deoxy-L-arabinose transferase-like glycosyltransferase
LLAGGLATGSLLLAQGVPFLFDWDELIYASLARHMLVTGHWWELVINGSPFWEKPPLFFWLQSLGFLLFGISEASARLPNAIAGGMMVALVVWQGSRLSGSLFGWLWGLLLSTGWLPLLFAKTGLIDPVLNLAMLAALLALFEYEEKIILRRARISAIPLQGVFYRVLANQPDSPSCLLLRAGLYLGLATLAKGPLGSGLPLVIWGGYKLWHRQPLVQYRDIIFILFVTSSVVLSWIGLETLLQGSNFLPEFVRYQWRILSTDDGHAGPLYFHVLVYGMGCFPFAALSIAGMAHSLTAPPQQRSERTTGSIDETTLRLTDLTHLMLVAFGIVLVLFSCIVQTKLIHYTSFLYPLGSYFAALRLHFLLTTKQPPTLGEVFWIASTGILLGGILLALAWIGNHPEILTPFLSDPVALTYLDTPVEWSAVSYAGGLCLWIGVVVWGITLHQAPIPSYGQTPAWILLLISTWLSAQLSWSSIFPSILEHTQGGAVRFFHCFNPASQELSLRATPVGLYGFRSFIPFFYGPLHVPFWTETELPDPQKVNYLVTWSSFADEVKSHDWDPVARSGVFVIFKATQKDQDKIGTTHSSELETIRSLNTEPIDACLGEGAV